MADDWDLKAIKARKAEKDRQAALQAAAEDPETAAILEETRRVQTETAQSARTAARTIQETVIVAERTTATLKQQGEQLEKIEGMAASADAHADDAYKSARELHKYKGWFPFSLKQMFTGGRKKAQDSELHAINKRLEKEAKHFAKDAHENPIITTSDFGDGRRRSTMHSDAVEREINKNLEDISQGLDVLKQQGLEMQRELVVQKTTVAKIEARTAHTEYTLDSANRKVHDFL